MNVSVEALAIPIAVAALGFAFKVSRDVVTLQTQMSVVWPQVKFVTAMNLHSPNDHRGMDDLLIRYAKGVITNEELSELITKTKRIESSGSEEEKLKAQGLLRMIKVEYQLN